MIVRAKERNCSHGVSNFEMVVESHDDVIELRTLSRYSVVHVSMNTVCIMGVTRFSYNYTEILMKDAIVIAEDGEEQYVEEIALRFDTIDALEIIVSKESEYLQVYYEKSNDLKSLLLIFYT